jgi:glycosyltransferase involved in cell wall biosynthesis
MNFLIPYLMRWNSLNRSRYYQLAVNLAQQGHSVHVLQPPSKQSADTGFVSVDETPHQGITIYDIPINETFWNMNLPFDKIFKKGYYCFLINQQIKQWVHDLSIDVLIYYNLALYPLSRIKSCVTVYDLGDDHIELLKAELGRFAFPWVIQQAEKWTCQMMRKSSLVTTISKDLEKKYPVPSTLLPNGINWKEIDPGSGKEIRASLKTPIVGFVGSLEYFIDFDLILEAASRLPEVTFLIAGGGRQLSRITGIKQERGLANVHLTGGCPHAEILRAIDAMDICLNLFIKSPLTDAACPIKLFEYMAYQKPVISTRIREVQNIDEGFLYYADNADELTQAIRRILVYRGEAAEKGVKGGHVVEEKYTWDKITKQFLQAIENPPPPGKGT